MTTNANGLTAPHSQPVKKTYKQGRNCTPNQLKNAQIRHEHGAIIAPGARHTISEASNLHVSEVFPCPEFKCLDVGNAYPQGRRQRFGVVSKPHVHSFDLDSQRMVFEIPEGIKTMKPTTGQTAPTQNPDHQQTDLFFQASNHLSQALYQLRNATDDQGIKSAAGRANAAARALNRLVTAYSTKRKEVELVPVTDPRIAQHYPETSGGLSAEPDGPWLLAIGRKCTDQQLERFAKREGFSVAELVAFRDGLAGSEVKA